MTLSEIFTKAIMNTILGMGVVFSVLIFISFIISLFKYLPGLLEGRKTKKHPAAADDSASIRPADATDRKVSEDTSEGDPVMVAVITAAVHALMREETVTTDAYVVRSIRRI
ncbi:MAG: OadG family protein [Eubacteriales bacterium]|jgi:sodium pump decarboxylase gamma subunit|nr:OadG family protein [Eubacteriales bacterium]MDD3289579.1 OadG family protein [Eubacteriales bacterium]MDD3863378.1 OadG family protein [Eubacteriales bacterium]MDD4445971.1 OadG family protein [Eubacteriales bacterium]